MPLPVIASVLFLAMIFLFLPFVGDNRFFSMPVDPEWLAGSQAKRVRRAYKASVVLLSALCTAVALYSKSHPHLIFAVPLFAVVGLMTAWTWGWRQTLPFRLQHSITRVAALRPQAVGRATWWWSIVAMLPIFATALVLLCRYHTIPTFFPIHFNAEGVPNHIVLRSWLSVFGPLIVGCVVILLVAELLRGIQRQGAGVADGGRYSVLTGRFVAGVAWMVGLECSATGLLPIMRHAGTYAAHLGVLSGATDLILLLITTGVLIRNKSVLVSGQNATDATHWKGGVLYVNRDDAALFVPKRLGFGWTLNMAQPAAWLLMGLVLAIALVPLALKHL